MSEDILSCIEGKLPSFSKGKKSIANFILQSPHEAAFMTAANLGKTVKVSESTVVRFASDLGYSGYPELQKALQDVVMHDLTHREEVACKSPGQVSMTLEEELWQKEQGEVRSFFSNFEPKLLSEAAELLSHCRCLFIIGRGSASCLAEFMEYSMDGILDHVKLVKDATNQQTLRTLVHISPGDCVMYFCTEEDRSILPTLQFLVDTGAKLLTIRDKALPYSINRTELEISIPMMDSFGIPNYGSAMEVLHTIISLVSRQRARYLSETDQKFKEIWDKYYENQSNRR